MLRRKKAGTAERKRKMQWNPQIAMVTSVAVILIIAISAFSGYVAINAANANAPLELEQTIYSCLPTLADLNKDLEIKLYPIYGVSPCETDGKLELVSFGSLTCPHCNAQRPVLQELAAEDSRISLKLVCLSSQADCEANGTAFVPYDEGVELYQKYASDLQNDGIPTLISNCGFKRVGSLAYLRSPEDEKAELKTLFSRLL